MAEFAQKKCPSNDRNHTVENTIEEKWQLNINYDYHLDSAIFLTT